MNWQPIETAPENEEIVIYCRKAQCIIMLAKKVKSKWYEYDLDSCDRMSWRTLETYIIPTHWMKLEPPKEVQS
jgi:hypothetical protein